MLEPEALRTLVEALRAGGVRRYRDGSVEIELAPLAPAAPVSSKDDPGLTREQQHEAHMSMLLKSAGGVVPARLKRVPAMAKE